MAGAHMMSESASHTSKILYLEISPLVLCVEYACSPCGTSISSHDVLVFCPGFDARLTVSSSWKKDGNRAGA